MNKSDRHLLTIINIASLGVMFAAVINLIAFRELWILAAAAVILVGLAAFSVKERRRLQKDQQKADQKT